MPVFLAVFAEEIIRCALLEEIAITDTATAERLVVLEQVAAEYVVARAFANFTDIFAAT